MASTLSPEQIAQFAARRGVERAIIERFLPTCTFGDESCHWAYEHARYYGWTAATLETIIEAIGELNDDDVGNPRPAASAYFPDEPPTVKRRRVAPTNLERKR